MAKSYLENLLGARETIHMTSRQHWFILASMILLEIVLIFIILATIVFTSLNFREYTLWILLGGFLILLIPTFTMTRDILNWTHHQYVITNRRVMQISGVINKSVTDSSLEKVNDVKMTQSFLGRLFDYGDIEILTASELGVNLFKRIAKPVQFKTTMLNAKERLEHGDFAEDDQSIPKLIAQLDQLRKQGLLSEAEFQTKKEQLLSRL